MDTKTVEAIGSGIGDTFAEFSLTILVLVDALKQQPGFDKEAFDAVLLKALEHPSAQEKLILRSTLNAALETPRES